MPHLKSTFRNTTIALSLAALPFLLPGCTTSAPAGLDSTISQSGPLLQLRPYIGTMGSYAFSNEYFWVYDSHSMKPGRIAMTALVTDHCSDLGGRINTSNPAKISHKNETLILNSCDLPDGPAFLYSHFIRSNVVRYAVAEKRSDVSQADFVQYLNRHGYQSFAQSQALKDAKNEALRKEQEAINEDRRKSQARIDAWYIPLHQKTYSNEVQRAKKASKGTEICKLSYYPAWNKTVNIGRYSEGFLEEHSAEKLKMLSNPYPGMPQTVTWVKYGDYGLCD